MGNCLRCLGGWGRCWGGLITSYQSSSLPPPCCPKTPSRSPAGLVLVRTDLFQYPFVLDFSLFPPLLFSFMESCYFWNNFDKMLDDTIAWSISLNLFISVSCWRKIGFSVILFNFHIPNNSEIKWLVIDQSGLSCVNVFMPCRKRWLWASMTGRRIYRR